MRYATIWRDNTRRIRARSSGRVLLPAFAIIGLSLALSGCLGSTFAYVSHANPDGTELYFKIPARWTMFTAKQIVTAQNGPLSNAQINQIESGQWLNAFNAAPHPNVKDLLDEESNYPNGIVIAKKLDETSRDDFSLAAMRAEILGQDPLATSTGTASPFNVLNYSEYTSPGGVRGSRLTTDINLNGGLVATFSQIVDVDPQTNWVFAIGVACRASCWGPNQGLINEILNSWNVKEQT